MSSATLTVNFAFSDSTTKSFSFGPFDIMASAVTQFRTRLRKFNSVDETSQKKFTNLADVLISDNGAALSGIKSASITVSESTRIYDSVNFGG